MTDASTGFDVVVVGAGLAGCAAALSASEAGATVCLLEKSDVFGGSSVKAGGGFLFAATDLQREAEVDDDVDALRKAIFEAGHHVNDPVVVEAYVLSQLQAYEWLQRHGVEFSLAPAFAPGEVPRVHAASPAVVTEILLKKFLESGRAAYFSNACASRLQCEDGRVDAVTAEIEGSKISIAARNVILATGGFARSRELLQRFAPKSYDAVKMGGIHSTGDGLRMALKLGADLADMGYIEPSFGASVSYPVNADTHTVGASEPRLLYANTRGAIIVNLEGRRFVNEMLDYKKLGEACAHQLSELAIQIFDEKVMRRSRSTPATANFVEALEQGHIKEAGSLAELAELLDIDPVVLQDSVDRYNANARHGVDPEFGRPIPSASEGGGALEDPPFYAYPCGAGLTTTYCGIRVDQGLRVVDVFEEPIPGLLAAGEVVGGFHGAGYLTGTGLGKAAVFGFAAGRNATTMKPVNLP